MGSLEKLTMDAIEELFVNGFLVQERRARSMFELGSKKKRRNFFSGLYGGSSKLDQRFVSKVEGVNSKNEQKILFDLLSAKHAEKTCYLMSYMPEIDRQFFSLSDGLANLLACPMESVLVCGEHLALLHGEANTSVQPLWLLEKKKS